MTELYLIATERPRYNKMSTDTTYPKNKFEINKKKYDKIIELKTPMKKIKNLDYWSNYKNEMLNKIEICEHEKLNAISENDIWAFSRSWYKRQEENDGNLFCIVRNNLYNYFRHISGGKSKDNCWVTYEEYKEQLNNKGYTKGFVNSDCDLSKFDNCKNFAYLMNKYPSDLEKDNNEYADLLTIYDLIRIVKYITVDLNHELNLYIPSKRVRELFKDWLFECKTEKNNRKLKEYIMSLINKPLNKENQKELINEINFYNENRLQKSYDTINSFLQDNYNLHIDKKKEFINCKLIVKWIIKQN